MRVSLARLSQCAGERAATYRRDDDDDDDDDAKVTGRRRGRARESERAGYAVRRGQYRKREKLPPREGETRDLFLNPRQSAINAADSHGRLFHLTAFDDSPSKRTNNSLARALSCVLSLDN